MSALRFERLTAAIGAIAHDADLSLPIRSQTADGLLEGLLTHHVLVFPEAHLSPEVQIALAECVGPVWPRHPFFPSVEGAPAAAIIADGPHSPPENAEWHSDMSPSNPPPFASVLQARIIPEVGGDTLWCSMSAVHDSLSDEVREKLEGLVAVHTLDHAYLRNLDNGKLENRADVLENTPADQRLSRHPVIMVHPATGRALVYVNDSFTSHIEGVSRDESLSLLQHIYSLIGQPGHQMRLRWQPGTVVIYDNFATQHHAVGDHFPAVREMNRVTVGTCRWA